MSNAYPQLRHAATTILLREQTGRIEVLMTRRHADLAFMGGMWVFPGGALAAADQSAVGGRCVPASSAFRLHDMQGDALPPQLCLALAIAACRETFEETGILLAHRSDGSPLDAEQLARFKAERSQIAVNPVAFFDALERETLLLDLDRLIYWAHWITPSSVPRRFDTRFFVARAPDRHDLIADTYETAECVWATPQELLERADRGAMRIPQPTFYTLEDLRSSIERHRTLDALMRAESRREVAAIMPKMCDMDGKTIIVMPWDPSYPSIPGEGVRMDQRFEPALLALPGRIQRDH